MDPGRENKMRWSYPDDLDGDLRGQGLAPDEVAEVLSAAWEYARCVAPEYSRWDRYMELVRLTAVFIVAEYCGQLIDFTVGPDGTLGYDVPALLGKLFGGSDAHRAQEFTSSILFTAEKSCDMESDLLHRYIDALAVSPADYFRMRDCDGLAGAVRTGIAHQLMR